MKYNQSFLNKIIDKALEISGYETTISEIEKKKGEAIKEQKGKKKQGIEWYIEYHWHNDEEYTTWLSYVEKLVKRQNPQYTTKEIEVDVSILDMLCAPSHSYLFKSENTLF